MIIAKSHFKKFVVDTEAIIGTLATHKPVAWGSDWEVVCIPKGDTTAIYEWAKDRLEGRIDVTDCHNGDVLVAFTDATDAILFKISYQNGV